MGNDSVKFLICDDSILARNQLRDLIKSLGNYEILEAANGQTAVECYKTQNPDFVFLDIVMPQKDGITAVKEIIEYNSEAKIIMVSSIGNKKYLKNALEAGAINFIQKPIDYNQVTKLLKSLLEGGK